MAARVVAAVAALVAHTVGAEILIMLPGSSAANAVCLDGSPYGLYFSPGTGDGVNKWAIYFQGGGWCYDAMSCLGRANTTLGSSTKWNPTYGVDGLLSQNSTVNPATYNWNHVLLPYCDGNSFSGYRDAPLVVNGTALHMRGHAIVEYVFDTVLPNAPAMLQAPSALGEASAVLLTGCSAGGLATFLHADYVASKVPATATYRVAPISGFFLDIDNVAGVPVYTEQMKVVFEMQNSSAGVDQDCLAAHSADTAYLCNMAPHVLSYIQSPIFTLNSHIDWWQSQCVLTAQPIFAPNSSGAVDNCSSVPGWHDCAVNTEACTNEQMPLVNGFSSSMLTAYSASGTSAKPGNGAFLVSCHTHCEGESTPEWLDFTINGVTMRDAVVAWLAADHDPAEAHTHVDCLLHAGSTPRQCNPSCGTHHTWGR